ncbi:MAG: RNA pseudouridine synthase, partial [Tissierellia bacterium]|nr:RNA pseudouridine synthase [Tissierellia bacterium]
QLSHIGHPIICDPIYVIKNSYGINSQMLVAKRLHFVHPIKNFELIIEKKLSSEFQDLMKKLIRENG